jgi:hypothetical protein
LTTAHGRWGAALTRLRTGVCGFGGPS